MLKDVRMLLGWAAILLVVQTIGACGRTSLDYRAAAKAVISGNIRDQAGVKRIDAFCDRPSTVRVGSTFDCTGVTENGETIRFRTTIVSETKVDVASQNLITPAGIGKVEFTAVKLLEQEVGQKLGSENFDCGDNSIIADPPTDLACTLTDPVTGHLFDASVTLPSFEDLSSMSVVVADRPRK